jgi:glutamate racemase
MERDTSSSSKETIYLADVRNAPYGQKIKEEIVA